MSYVYVLWDNYDGGQIIGVYDTLSAGKIAFLNEWKENIPYIEKYCETEGMDYEEERDIYLQKRLNNLSVNSSAWFRGEGDYGYYDVTLEIKEVK